MVSLEGAVQPTSPLDCLSSIVGTLGAQVGKALGRDPRGWSGTPIPDVNRLAVARLGFLLWKVGHWE